MLISLLQMLVTTAQLVVHTADCLRAEDVTAEQTDARVAELLLRVRAAASVGLLDQTVEELGETDKFKDRRVGKTRPQAVVFKANARARRIPMEDPPRDDSVEGAIALSRRADDMSISSSVGRLRALVKRSSSDAARSVKPVLGKSTPCCTWRRMTALRRNVKA